MNTNQKTALFLLRLSLGWYFLYAGVTKIMDPKWSAAGYLKGAKILSGFYGWLASPGILPVINFVNEWGLALLGVALITGILLRPAAWAGIVLMALYYLPLGILHPDAHSLIVDDHIIFIFGLAVLSAFNAGNFWSLARKKAV